MPNIVTPYMIIIDSQLYTNKTEFLIIRPQQIVSYVLIDILCLTVVINRSLSGFTTNSLYQTKMRRWSPRYARIRK